MLKSLLINMKKRHKNASGILLILLSLCYSGGSFAEILEPTQKAIANFLTPAEKLVVAEGAEKLVITPHLKVRKKDRGKSADLFVMAMVDGAFFVNSEESGWIHKPDLWPPFRRSVTLARHQAFPIYTGSEQQFFNIFSNTSKSGSFQQPNRLKNVLAQLDNDFQNPQKVIHIFYAYHIKGESPIFYGNHFRLTASTMAQKLQQFMDKTVTNCQIPGAVMAVKIPNEGQWVGTSGVSDLQNQTEMLPNDKFRVASATKTFTALTILQLAQEGKLKLKDTLQQWLPGVVCGKETENCHYQCQGTNCDFEPSQMTIRQLLTHFTGLWSFTFNPSWREAIYIDPTRVFTPTDLVNMTLTLGQFAPPNEKFFYSNTNYILLGLIIEKVTGSSWENEVFNRFIKPLKLKETVIPEIGDTSLPAPYAQGYLDLFNASGGQFGNPGELINSSELDPGFTWSSGDMISTPENLLDWITKLAEGDLLNKKYQKKMLTFRTDPDNPQTVGYEMGLGIIKKIDFNAIGHPGELPGYECSMFYQLSTHIPLSVCINRRLEQPENQRILVQDLLIWDVFSILEGKNIMKGDSCLGVINY